MPALREAGESHRDADVVLDEHLLGLDVVVPAHPQALLAHRRWEVPFPEIGRLADVPVGVDDHHVVDSRAHRFPLTTRHSLRRRVPVPRRSLLASVCSLPQFVAICNASVPFRNLYRPRARCARIEVQLVPVGKGSMDAHRDRGREWFRRAGARAGADRRGPRRRRALAPRRRAPRRRGARRRRGRRSRARALPSPDARSPTTSCTRSASVTSAIATAGSPKDSGRAAAAAGVGRIVYLGGLGDDPESEHLVSRQEVGGALGVERGRGRRAARRGRARRGQRLVRDAALPHRAAAVHGLPALGSHRDPTDRA